MKLINTNLNDLKFWYRSDDKYVGQRIALGKYEEYETLLMMAQVNKESVAVDVGANIGYYTVLLAQRCKKVFAFEPDITCFEILKKNVEENNLENVILINKAVGERKEKGQWIVDEVNLGNSRLSSEDCFVAKAPRNDVLVDTLDNFLKNEQKIDLIKIDTQGWESQVIAGAKNTLKKFKPILFLEYTPVEYKDDLMIKFLKNIYKNIWSIDYWFYICRPGIWVDKKTGYVDLFLKNKFDFKDFWWMIKEIKMKKIASSIFLAKTFSNILG